MSHYNKKTKNYVLCLLLVLAVACACVCVRVTALAIDNGIYVDLEEA